MEEEETMEKSKAKFNVRRKLGVMSTIARLLSCTAKDRVQDIGFKNMLRKFPTRILEIKN